MLLHAYHQTNYGRNVQLDATNSLRLLVSYPDYSVITLLDQTLSELSTFHLNEIGITHFSAACISESSNNVWIYDDHDFRIKKINSDRQITWQSDDMISVTGKAILPQYMIERNNRLYLDDPQSGIFVFDLYGHWLQTLPIPDVSYFDVTADALLFVKDHRINESFFSAKQNHVIQLPDSIDAANYCFCGNKFLTIDKSAIHVYRLQ